MVNVGMERLLLKCYLEVTNPIQKPTLSAVAIC